jgi:hypothetical protein
MYQARRRRYACSEEEEYPSRCTGEEAGVRTKRRKRSSRCIS